MRPLRYHDDVLRHRRSGPERDFAAGSGERRAMAGMARAAEASKAPPPRRRAGEDRPLVGLTMFASPPLRAASDETDWRLRMSGVPRHRHRRPVDGEAGRRRLVSAVIDVSTTEIADLLFGGVFPATEDGSAPSSVPGFLCRSVGALDMVNFGAPDTVPSAIGPVVSSAQSAGHPDADSPRNAAMGRWIGDRANLMEGPVRFLLPEGGVSALDEAGKPFFDTRRARRCSARWRRACGRRRRASSSRPASYQQSGICGALVQHFRALQAHGRTRGGPVGSSMAAIDGSPSGFTR